LRGGHPAAGSPILYPARVGASRIVGVHAEGDGTGRGSEGAFGRGLVTLTCP